MSRGVHASVVFVASGVALAAVTTLGACSTDTDLSGSLAADGGSPIAEGGAAADAVGPSITVTTLAPARTTAPAAKASATWAAYRLDDGAWNALAPSSIGTYSFPYAAARWAIALVCANADDSFSTVYVHHRTNATPDVEVALDDACTPPPPPAEFAFTGTLQNVPATTEWLDFGYARDSRGDAVPVTGNTATYEVVGIEPGTWDFAFGVRDDSFHALTRVALRRDHVVTADEVVDVDVMGPGSFAPGTRALRLHGLVAGDTVAPKIFYAAGGPFGIDVGPQDIPDGLPDVTLAYSTVPEAAQIASDRYRGELTAEQDRRTGARSIDIDFHRDRDLDLTFLPDPAEPAVRVVSTSPQVVIETRFAVLPNAERHEVSVLTSENRRTQQGYRSTYDALSVGAAAEVVDTTPELSALPGWRPAWSLVAGQSTTVLATGYETRHPMGDGTMQRAAAKGLSITP